ncbi:type II toxin-antitoxin system HicA family toxin [bacterium]|nr:type II toxin-antitoxin system HicA family toxin [bacterium]
MGYILSSQSGSHMVYRHPEKVHNITIPYKSGHEIQPEIIQDLITKAGITRIEYLEFIENL